MLRCVVIFGDTLTQAYSLRYAQEAFAEKQPQMSIPFGQSPVRPASALLVAYVSGGHTALLVP